MTAIYFDIYRSGFSDNDSYLLFRHRKQNESVVLKCDKDHIILSIMNYYHHVQTYRQFFFFCKRHSEYIYNKICNQLKTDDGKKAIQN